eukprot:TRINITY_DN139_c0_g1_i1.p1 TRINITY_DN139_c0_g1~~TRINITY_DN139_c0_g1_i1.p1  ORF type:complete len:592 (+),score=195.36 TRINITY_DN139_c0_g1_i1:108-1883(+)
MAEGKPVENGKKEKTGKKKKHDDKKATMTDTQLRNLRKREAKKRKASAAEKKTSDPSLQYLKDPLQAPTVREAGNFFSRKCGVPNLPVNLGKLEGWRTEAKLAVRASKADGPVIGLFQPGSHRVVALDRCLAHHPSIDEAVRLIKEACPKAGVHGYDEEQGKGDLRYLKMDVERSTGKVQLTLVWHAASREAAGKALDKLVEELQTSEHWYSIWANFHPASKHVSRILAFEDSAWQRLAGKKKILREELSSVDCASEPKPRLCFPPNVFRQANICAFEGIVTRIRQVVPEGSRVVELYGGVGTIGIHLADLVKRLACSDENPHNQACFERTVSELPEELGQKLSYSTGDAVSQVETLATADVVIVDPPRKGLDEAVLAALEAPAKRIKRLIYVSCGFPAFQRDCVRLKAADWQVVHAEGFVLFPGADHLETLCVFDRPGTETKEGYSVQVAKQASEKSRKRKAEAMGEQAQKAKGNDQPKKKKQKQKKESAGATADNKAEAASEPAASKAKAKKEKADDKEAKKADKKKGKDTDEKVEAKDEAAEKLAKEKAERNRKRNQRNRQRKIKQRLQKKGEKEAATKSKATQDADA